MDLQPRSWEIGNSIPSSPIQSRATDMKQKTMNKLAVINVQGRLVRLNGEVPSVY